MDTSQPIEPGDFSQLADAYARARPSYPQRLVKRLALLAGVHPGDHVADLGAGTGIFSQQLLALGLMVDAVEPAQNMRQQAWPRPGIRWYEGTFEKIPLPDRAVRWATAAQAFHWAKIDDALPEIARILQPGCPLTVLWNKRLNQENDVTRWTIQTIQRIIPGFVDMKHQTNWTRPLQSTGHFHRVTYMEEAHFIRMSPQRYIELWQSHNHLTVEAGPRRMAQLVDELRTYLQKESIHTIDVPYRCQSWTALRKD